MATIQLPKLNYPQVQVPPSRVGDQGGEAFKAQSQIALGDTIFKAIQFAVSEVSDISREHKAMLAQKAYDDGRLAYIKAMDDTAINITENPVYPDADNPYPTAQIIEDTHNKMVKELVTIKNPKVRDALDTYYNTEFQKRQTAARIADSEKGREMAFDGYAEKFETYVQKGMLDEAEATMGTMVTMGLVTPKQADDALDKAHMVRSIEETVSAALGTGSREAAYKIIGDAKTFKGYDGKEIAFRPEQQEAMAKEVDERFKAAEAQAKQAKSDNWYTAGNQYIQLFDKSKSNPMALKQMKDFILADKRSDDFEGHRGLKKQYVDMIDKVLEDINKGGNPGEFAKTDNPETYGRLLTVWQDDTIPTPLFKAQLQSALISGDITEGTFNFLKQDGNRTEAPEIGQGFDRIKSYFGEVSKDKRLKLDDQPEVDKMKADALNAYTKVINDPKWLTYDQEQRRELLKKTADNIITDYTFKNVYKLLNPDQDSLDKYLYVASPYANKTNQAKDFQRKIQGGGFTPNPMNQQKRNQHQNNLIDMASETIGTAPQLTYKSGELKSIGQNAGDVVFGYKVNLPDPTSRSYPEQSQYAYSDASGNTYHLFRWRVEDDNVWKLQLYNKGKADWQTVDKAFLQTGIISGKPYWRNTTPTFVDTGKAPEEMTTDERYERYMKNRDNIMEPK